MAKSRTRSSSNLSKPQGTDLSEYLLLFFLVALIIGAVALHVAHVHLP